MQEMFFRALPSILLAMLPERWQRSYRRPNFSYHSTWYTNVKSVKLVFKSAHKRIVLKLRGKVQVMSPEKSYSLGRTRLQNVLKLVHEKCIKDPFSNLQCFVFWSDFNLLKYWDYHSRKLRCWQALPTAWPWLLESLW